MCAITFTIVFIYLFIFVFGFSKRGEINHQIHPPTSTPLLGKEGLLIEHRDMEMANIVSKFSAGETSRGFLVKIA